MLETYFSQSCTILLVGENHFLVGNSTNMRIGCESLIYRTCDEQNLPAKRHIRYVRVDTIVRTVRLTSILNAHP
jgi:hypothetical protein